MQQDHLARSETYDFGGYTLTLSLNTEFVDRWNKCENKIVPKPYARFEFSLDQHTPDPSKLDEHDARFLYNEFKDFLNELTRQYNQDRADDRKIHLNHTGVSLSKDNKYNAHMRLLLRQDMLGTTEQREYADNFFVPLDAYMRKVEQAVQHRGLKKIIDANSPPTQVAKNLRNHRLGPEFLLKQTVEFYVHVAMKTIPQDSAAYKALTTLPEDAPERMAESIFKRVQSKGYHSLEKNMKMAISETLFDMPDMDNDDKRLIMEVLPHAVLDQLPVAIAEAVKKVPRANAIS